MNTAVPTLGAFVVRTFLWMPPCFAAWYFSAQFHAAVAGRLARFLVDQFKSGMVSALEQSGLSLMFVTTLVVHPAPGQTGVLVPEVNPLLYTYGIALFLALMLAARTQWWKILLGAALLVPFQSWGIAFDFLSQVSIKLGPEVAAQAGMLGWRREAIALGYQLGSLIFPSLVPVLVWAAFNPLFITECYRASSRDRPKELRSRP